MDPITETTQISLAFSQTANISLTTLTMATNTFSTTGTIYLPYPFLAYEPITTLASFLLFLFIGVMLGKPTSFIIAWIGLMLFGIFSIENAYWSYSLLVVLSGFTLYRYFHTIALKE